MMNLSEVEQIINKLALEKTMVQNENLSKEVSCIVYRTDIFKCGNNNIINRHIDIEFTFGDYYEICEDNSIFQYICSLCSLQTSIKEQDEVLLYQK